jgi:hypothetical protein
MNGMIIFVSATVIAIVAIILERRRSGRSKQSRTPAPGSGGSRRCGRDGRRRIR